MAGFGPRTKIIAEERLAIAIAKAMTIWGTADFDLENAILVFI